MATGYQGMGIIDKAKEKGTNELRKGGVAESLWRVDFKTGWNLLTNPDTWKTPSSKEIADIKMRVEELKRS